MIASKTDEADARSAALPTGESLRAGKRRGGLSVVVSPRATSICPLAPPAERGGWQQLVVLVMALSLWPGCAESNVGVVTGSVTVDGAPAPSGSIAFFPADGNASVAGGEIANGQYEVQVAPGPARVEIRISKVVGQKKLYDTPDSPVKPVLAESLPPRYNDQTELTLDVQRGENQQNWELTTK